MKSLGVTFSVLALCAFGPVYAAVPDCTALQAPNQKPDADSVKRAERAWLVAEFRGDVDTVACMLEPDYTEIRFNGSLGHKDDILKGAAKAKGSTKPIPTVTWAGVVVKGDSATAYTVQDKQDMGGKPVKLFFTDTFIYHDGAWHPYFSVNASAVAELKIKG
ncbi:MAG TPA: nuclear transport factor 2 family protein, partial [Gammaproteobacteria bacterium]|nr:nuclear transport factor 2 family protein [Gammaproteobacteria bacterium]